MDRTWMTKVKKKNISRKGRRKVSDCFGTYA